MKWLFALLLAVLIFGGAAWFGYNLFFKQEIAVQKEQRGEITPAPRPTSVCRNFRRPRNCARKESFLKPARP